MARTPWTTALLAALSRSGEYRWYDVDRTFKRLAHTVPEDRALRQYEQMYRWQQVKPSREVMVEKGRRNILQVSLFSLARKGAVIVDPPLSLDTRRQKRRMRLAAPPPGARATPWTRVMYSELEDGEWHDMAALIRKMARAVPPNRAAANYRTNIKTARTGARPERVKATTRQRQVRDGGWDLCRRAIIGAARRGRVEISVDGAGKKVRQVGCNERKEPDR